MANRATLNHRESRIGPPLTVERRSELLDLLEEIFLAEGFLGLTLDELASRLRCSKTTLYRLASSKEQLVVTVGRHFVSGAALRVEVAVANAATPPEKLAAYLTTVGRETARGSAAFHEQMATEPCTAGLYARNIDAAANRVSELIQEGIHEGFFHVPDGELAARIVANIIHAIHLGDLVTASRHASLDAHTKLSDLLLYGLIGANDSRARAATR
jgi:excisionase family DNA binding protein